MYLANIPLYPGGLHCFTIGSKIYDPVQVSLPAQLPFSTKYYNRELHRSCFNLPNFVRELTGSEG
jgi:spermidine synthase